MLNFLTRHACQKSITVQFVIYQVKGKNIELRFFKPGYGYKLYIKNYDIF
jgi:hypothetical protein